MALAHLLLLLLPFAPPSPPPQTTFIGCASRLPDGTLQLGTVPAGRSYRLQGRTRLLEEHMNQLVRVSGQVETGRPTNAAPPILTVNTVQPIAETCTSVLPAKNPEPVEGKVGEDSIAIPVSTTAVADETTPGFQTESGMAQSPGAQNVPANLFRRAARSPYAPLHPEQEAQSELAANVNAQAAERTEILPGNTLGTGTSAINPAAPPPSSAAPARAAAQPVIVEIRGNENPELSSPRVTIKPGQIVQWRNSSPKIHEVIANPARAKAPSNALLPSGAKPFDSGLLRRDHSFSYRFTVPGVYRYFCDLNSAHPVEGEVIVTR
jgi:plastocyanin